MLTTFIIEDEQPARLRLRKLLTGYATQLKVLGEADTGQGAITQIEELRPQVVFLDIQLPDMTGFEVLRQLTYRPLVIFSTAYEEYALQAFQSLSVDYLVKPYDRERFEQAIAKLVQFSGKEQPRTDIVALEQLLTQLQPQKKESFSLPIKSGDRIILVDYESITHLQAEDKYTVVHTKLGKRHLTEQALGKLEKTLPDRFLRVHRSYIINKAAILEIRKYFKGKLILVLDTREKISVTTGETYSVAVRKALGI